VSDACVWGGCNGTVPLGGGACSRCGTVRTARFTPPIVTYCEAEVDQLAASVAISMIGSVVVEASMRTPGGVVEIYMDRAPAQRLRINATDAEHLLVALAHALTTAKKPCVCGNTLPCKEHP